MVIYSIYKATNKVNNKVYIGFAVNFSRRLASHKKLCGKRKTKFYDAINSYGWDKFDWEIIYQSKDGQHCLNVMERFFIIEYNSINEGYNMTEGGGGTLGIMSGFKGKKHDTETKQILSSLRTGTKHTNETKQKISESTKGRKVTQETKLKMLRNDNHKMKINVTCDYCGKNGSYVIMSRWHGDKCVVKKQQNKNSS